MIPAFVPAAGLGTRLRPLTERLPKPLVPVANKPLITFALDHLAAAGVRTAVINTHRLPETFRQVFPSGTYRGMALDFSHEPELLNTGGGLRQAYDRIGRGPLLVHSADVLTDLPIAPLLEEHRRAGNLVTLALRSAGGPLHVAFDPENRRVIDIRAKLGAGAGQPCLYANLCVLEEEFLRGIPPDRPIHVVDEWLRWMRAGAKVGGVLLDGGVWSDLGTRESYLAAHRLAASGWRPDYVDDPGWPLWIHPAAHVSDEARFEGFVAVGPRCTVGPGARLRDTVLWEDVEVAGGAVLERCIVARPGRIEGALRDQDIAGDRPPPG